MEPIKPANIDQYIAAFSSETREKLEQIRSLVRNLAPQAEEVISYGMPAFKLNGILVYFAAFKNHIGFYPLASGIEWFREDLSEYKWAKGSIQFPLSRPLPLDLITKILAFRIHENLQKRKNRKKEK